MTISTTSPSAPATATSTSEAVPVPAESRASWPESRRGWGARLRLAGDDGMTTAEYAIGTLAAVIFAGVLLKIFNSSEVFKALLNIILKALNLHV
jgi:hypothetical protein